MKRRVKIMTMGALCAALCLCAFAFAFSCASEPPPPPAPPAPAAPAVEPEPAPAALEPQPAPAVEAAPVQTAAAPQEKKAPPAGGLDLSGAKKYTVRYRDTLSSIARRQYGGLVGACYFPIILEASKDVIRNPDRIIPGMRLTIPDLKRNTVSAESKAVVKPLLLNMAKTYETRRAHPKTVAALRKEAAKL